MDSQKPTVDLEKELTCSICTDVLYQPLTLLDCLHTFCGACLREWFGWQAAAAENAPSPPAPGSPIFTCPACRAPVRDAKHNADVGRLLDIFLAVNPDKAKPEDEKEAIGKKYKPGDKVLPKLNIPEVTPEQKRQAADDRRLIQEVRELSLREAVAESSLSTPRRHGESRSPHGRSGHGREASRETRARDARERSRRHGGDEDNRRRAEQTVMLQPEGRTAEERRRRHGHSEARSRESSETRHRHVEHQSSLRSLISSSNIDSRDIEREIEDFARQIQEEGLLDGLDLDNLDLSNNDELSRKITEAYRRRQRERNRHDVPRRSGESAGSRHSDVGPSNARTHAEELPMASGRQRAHSQESSTARRSEEAPRPPPALSSGHLEIHDDSDRRHRRRTTSGARSATTPVTATQPEPRTTPRAQTDLALRSTNPDQAANRPSIGDGRSTSSPAASTVTQSPTATQSLTTEASRNPILPFSARVASSPVTPPAQAQAQGTSENQSPPTGRARRPPDLEFPPLYANFASSSPHSPGRRRRPQLYPEPSLVCVRCGREHIEYEVHYNCTICHGGNWNICTNCYRTGKDCCLNWFGFGHAAWTKWEKARLAGGDTPLAEPHVLTAHRFTPPPVIPGGADGRRTLTTEDPARRLQSGVFCSRCLAWVNDCSWQCDVCNDGEWSFCIECVNTGRACTHPLMPVAYEPQRAATTPTSPRAPSPRSPTQPAGAAFPPGPSATHTRRYRPLALVVRCEVCRDAIPTAESHYHCPACPSAFATDGHPSNPGEYNICQVCYAGLVSVGSVSAENGPAGWRRCPLAGHRMVVVALRGGLQPRRHMVLDLVGGRGLHVDEAASEGDPSVQAWYWLVGGERRQRLATRDVRGTAPKSDADAFPPDGGVGWRAVARWAWHPAEGADDELLFPRGAEIREVEDVNGEWFHGVYMGARGLFPGPYVRRVEEDAGAEDAV